MFIPTLILKQLYTNGSLQNTDAGVKFSLKNRLKDSKLIALTGVTIGGQSVPLDSIKLDLGDGKKVGVGEISNSSPVDFPLRKTLEVQTGLDRLPIGKHEIEIAFEAKPFGKLKLKVDDSIVDAKAKIIRIPRSDDDDYGANIIKERQDFVEKETGAKLEHIRKYSFDPKDLQGNIENFGGVAQIPIGFAGPIKIDGEHAKGDFLVPLATTEGTLVASYNRGIKVLNLCGGATCSVVGDAMQRAPVFEFENARKARDFIYWINDNLDKITKEAEQTSSVAKLQYIDPFLSNKFAFLRFNYFTGDAAGQNMVGKATFRACSWIIDQYKGIQHFYLESNFATDKKASQINIMRTRGKRVVAEATLKRDILLQHMRVEPESLFHHSSISNVGSFMSGANNNGAHSPNAITAMFIATGQDVANVSESSAGLVYTEMTKEGDLYISITIPSLIVATYGGGTHLSTQAECLDIMGCKGKGKVKKLAEIVGGVVLAGEISLASAISSSDWVSSHEAYGRNR
ncbi:MAG TPA: hydroxymethylglutaryl-CoA reductase [Flavobacteriales bacterium]|nr:hydroxymethylglutaryl-CoA reductase [Flavobacteriales bacterium]HIO72379.1 hydroxymethylglutaryl-CoA reductase [Flavobacteriales bacterium]